MMIEMQRAIVSSSDDWELLSIPGEGALVLLFPSIIV